MAPSVDVYADAVDSLSGPIRRIRRIRQIVIATMPYGSGRRLSPSGVGTPERTLTSRSVATSNAVPGT